MQKSLLFIGCLLCSLAMIAQEEDEKAQEPWTTKGNFSLLFNQSAFNQSAFNQSAFLNWIAGGENSVAGNLGVNYDFNYLKDNITWDNKILASYGLTRTKCFYGEYNHLVFKLSRRPSKY